MVGCSTESASLRSKFKAELEDGRACSVQRNSIVIQELRDWFLSDQLGHLTRGIQPAAWRSWMEGQTYIDQKQSMVVP